VEKTTSGTPLSTRSSTDFSSQDSLILDGPAATSQGRRCVVDWAKPNGGMPHGTYLGPYVFLTVMINDLKSPLELHKFVDDCTLSEIIKKAGTSIMQQEIDSVDSWSSLNHSVINSKKTKEILIGSIQKNPPPLLHLGGQPVEHVTSYKLLCLHVADRLQWNEHVSSLFQGGTAHPFSPASKAFSNSSDYLLHNY